MNTNEIHGCSELWVAPEMRLFALNALSPKFADDKNFDIVYVAKEVFDDGYNHLKVCYRVSNPDRFVDRRNPGPETVTFLIELEPPKKENAMTKECSRECPACGASEGHVSISAMREDIPVILNGKEVKLSAVVPIFKCTCGQQWSDETYEAIREFLVHEATENFKLGINPGS